LLESAKDLGKLFKNRFDALAKDCDIVREVRVAGVMVGIELAVDGTPVVKECLAKRLLVNCTHGTVIRLLPAMNLTEEQAEEGCAILADVIRKLPRQA
jgi:acetylornithine/N-succinyldiaminopimelate aminotransferase